MHDSTDAPVRTDARGARSVLAGVWRAFCGHWARIDRRPLTFASLATRDPLYLYAGDVPQLEAYRSYIGLSLRASDHQHVQHDVTRPVPLPSGCADRFQSEDVFEHIPIETVPSILREVYRLLKPGGTFRWSMPDYGCDLLRARTWADADGNFVFDPGGGGRYVAGRVVDGGHLWFPTFAMVRRLTDASPFTDVTFYHYYDEAGHAVTKPIDYAIGMVRRTPDHDPRVMAPYRPLSIVVDCRKGSGDGETTP